MSFWICKYGYEDTDLCEHHYDEDCHTCEYGMEVKPVSQIVGCKFCDDTDEMYGTVCYIPHDDGNATDIPVNFCPNCGRKLI